MRLSLTTKLIVTTAVLLSVALGAAALSTVRLIEDLAQREATARRASEEAAMQRQTERLARNTAAAAALPVAEGNLTYLGSLLETTLQQDSRVHWLVIADADGEILAKSPNAPPNAVANDTLSRELSKTGGSDVPFVRDPGDSTRFTFGARLQVGERVVGQLRLGVSTAELERELAGTIEQAHQRARSFARGSLSLFALILLAGVLLGWYQGFRITRPLHALSEQASRIAGGDLQHRVNIRTRDEIETLAHDFNHMATQLGSLVAEAANKASLDREMNLARSIQEAMIPPPQVLQHGPLRVLGHCRPAAVCGGDWWTVRALHNDRVILVVADVTGHGIPSAMITATARGAVEALAHLDEALLTPERLLQVMDRAIRDVGDHQLLMTCFAALIDPHRGVIEFANAGQNFPYLLHMNARRELSQMTVLAARGSWLGGPPEQFRIDVGQRAFVPGDLLVCYTDGVIDRVDAEGNRFGERRLRALLANRTVELEDSAIVRIRDDIVDRMERFSRGQAADDDITLVLCQFEPAIAAAQFAARRRDRGES